MHSPVFVDKLAYTVGVSREFQTEVASNLMIVSDTTGIGKGIRFSRVLGHATGLLQSYKKAFFVRPIDNSEFTVTVQIEPRRPNCRFMRLEFNPSGESRSAEQVAEAIHSILRHCIPEYRPIMLLDAMLTRIDLAFDIPNVSIEDVQMFGVLRKQTSSTFRQSEYDRDRNGSLNAYYIGRRDADRCLCIYDKARERADAQTAEIKRLARDGRPFLGSPKRYRASTRVELRLRDAGRLGNFLVSSDNPFSNYSAVVAKLDALPGEDQLQINWIVDAMKSKGVHAMLSQIDDPLKRAAWERRLRSSTPSWWDPQALWESAQLAIRRQLLGDGEYPSTNMTAVSECKDDPVRTASGRLPDRNIDFEMLPQIPNLALAMDAWRPRLIRKSKSL